MQAKRQMSPSLDPLVIRRGEITESVGSGVRAAGRFGAHSLRAVLVIESTNGSTMTAAVEAVLTQLRLYSLPKTGQRLENKYWRVEVVEGWGENLHRHDATDNAEMSDSRREKP